MKRYIFTRVLLFLFFIILPFLIAWYLYRLSQIHPAPNKIIFCKNINDLEVRYPPAQNSFHYRTRLISNSNDPTDKVFCERDYFGDLDNTYVTAKNCNLELYHKEKLLWSSKINSPEVPCAFSLQRDGNLVLYEETTIGVNPMGRKTAISTQWDSQTKFNPMKTELRVQDQQMQIIQTSKDGSERLFYASEGYQGFREDMGEPRKIANRFILKKTQDEDKTILRRNEYIGDLNGTYLILQTNCNLQLLNKHKILWSFTPNFRHEMNCILTTDEKNQVVISRISNSNDPKDSYSQRIMQFDDEYSGILENWIMFEDDQPMIIQTLKNGSEITYISGIGLNNGLKLKRKPRQLAEKTLNIPKDEENFYTIERMDYIGNLTGLHFIFQQNCSLMLINGNEKLWELQPYTYNDPLMECLIRFDNYGKMVLERRYSSFYEGGFFILTANYDERDFITGYQFTLEDNQLVVTRQLTNRAPDIYLAGPNTNDTLFQIISNSSVMVNGNDKEDLVLPKMGFIGNLNGVYAMFKEDCNLVLYNKTEAIWESGTSRNEYDRECALILMRNGRLMVTSPWAFRREDYFWSTQDLTIDPQKEVLRIDLLVNNDGLWLVNVYTDGTVNRFKPQEGTNGFIHIPN